VVKWDLNMPSFVFYRGALVEERMPKVGEVVVTKAPRLDELAAVGIVPDVWYASHGIVLARLREGPAPAGAPRRAPEP
jgi:signal peptidase I